MISKLSTDELLELDQAVRHDMILLVLADPAESDRAMRCHELIRTELHRRGVVIDTEIGQIR